MIIVRNKNGKLEEVYPSIAAYMESPDHYIHMDDNKYDKYNKYPEQLTPEEWQR